MTRNSRIILFVVAFAAALLAGFGLAKIQTGDSSTDSSVSHAASEGDDHAGEGGDTHDEGDGHADEGGAGTEKTEGRLELSAAQTKASGIAVVAVSRGGGGETRLSGRVEPSVGARAAIAAPISGRVERVVVAAGDGVRSGQALAYVVSGEAATLRAAADAAAAEAAAARQVYQRDASLVGQGVVARQEMEASRARALAADANARAARAGTAAAGAPDASGRVAISSPVAGTVGGVQVTPGAFVNAGDLVASVTDPARTEIVFSAPPSVAARIAHGARIEATGPDGAFVAIVTGVAADVREQGGMTVVRARADSGQLPPAGSPVSGVVAERDTDADAGNGVTVPADAVQTVEGRPVVFVADGDGFQATPVLAGRRAGDRIEILQGLSGNERVAGTNAFLLKAELAKGEAEHGH